MKKLTIRLPEETDALWALHEIAKQIVQGFTKGEYHGVKWWIEEEE